jgi:hypothetical protein
MEKQKKQHRLSEVFNIADRHLVQKGTLTSGFIVGQAAPFAVYPKSGRRRQKIAVFIFYDIKILYEF